MARLFGGYQRKNGFPWGRQSLLLQSKNRRTAVHRMQELCDGYIYLICGRADYSATKLLRSSALKFMM